MSGNVLEKNPPTWKRILMLRPLAPYPSQSLFPVCCCLSRGLLLAAYLRELTILKKRRNSQEMGNHGKRGDQKGETRSLPLTPQRVPSLETVCGHAYWLKLVLTTPFGKE